MFRNNDYLTFIWSYIKYFDINTCNFGSTDKDHG